MLHFTLLFCSIHVCPVSIHIFKHTFKWVWAQCYRYWTIFSFIPAIFQGEEKKSINLHLVVHNQTQALFLWKSVNLTYGNIALLWRWKDFSSVWYSSVGPIAVECLWHNFDIGSRCIKSMINQAVKGSWARLVMEWDRQLRNSNKALHSSTSLTSFYRV